MKAVRKIKRKVNTNTVNQRKRTRRGMEKEVLKTNPDMRKVIKVVCDRILLAHCERDNREKYAKLMGIGVWY